MTQLLLHLKLVSVAPLHHESYDCYDFVMIEMFAMMIWNLVQLFHSAPPNFESFWRCGARATLMLVTDVGDCHHHNLFTNIASACHMPDNGNFVNNWQFIKTALSFSAKKFGPMDGTPICAILFFLSVDGENSLSV